MIRHTHRRWKAATAVAAAAVIAALGFAAPANAAGALVDPTATGSIAVHKYEKPEVKTGLPNNGTDVTDQIDLEPMAGITFQIQRVEVVDLTTNAGWVQASKLSDAFSAADPEAAISAQGYTLGTAVTVDTDASGVALFDDLDLGLYLVREIGAAAGSGYNNGQLTQAAPFLVTVPLTDPTARDGWLYDVHVYPKNSVIEDTVKTVDDADAANVGDTVSFTIEGDIPNDDPITSYSIVDPLDPRLTFVGGSVTVGFKNSTVPLVAGVDYEVITGDAVYCAPDATPGDERFTVQVRFTEAGLAKLTANNADKVVVGLDTTVNEVGEITNSGYTFVNGFDTDSCSVEWPPPGTAVTKWGEFTLHKFGQDADAAGLAGAQFQVYAVDPATPGAQPLTIAGVNVFTSNAAGLLTIEGLRYSTWADGAAVAPGEAGFIQYYLVEVVAPSGYELLAAPIPFTVDETTTDYAVESAAVDHVVSAEDVADVEIENVRANGGFELPLTGGTGAGIVYVGGLLLLAGGAYLMIVRRMRRAHA